MAHPHDDSDYVPLLEDGDKQEELISLEDGQNLRRRKPASDAPARVAKSLIPDRETLEESSSQPLAVAFVADFDAKKGHTITWKISADDVDIAGVEFKVLPSGAHTVASDYVFFKHRNSYGIACFGTIGSTTNVRGAETRAVGLLGNSLERLFPYRSELREQLKTVLENRDNTEGLAEIFNKSLRLDAGDGVNVIMDEFFRPEKEIFNDNGTALDVFGQFGAKIFSVWKLILLRKRILILASPPVEKLCRKAFLFSLMGNHDVDDLKSYSRINMLLYVDLNDIDLLRHASHYVGCTTEKILEMKTDCYDVLINNGEIKISDPRLRELSRVTDSDKEKFSDFLQDFELRSSVAFPSSGPFYPLEHVSDYFTALNNKILSGFYAANQSSEEKLTSDQMKSMSMSPSEDFSFLKALAQKLELSIQFESENWCPECRCF